MTMTKRLGAYGLIAILGLCTLAFGERFSGRPMNAIFSPAEARIGRPLTPMSVAGVARRTARRCAVGVYYC
jgi:hypothetical protein